MGKINNNHLEGIMGSTTMQNPWHIDTTNNHILLNAIKNAFLAKEWNFFYLIGKKSIYLHLEDFLNYECE